MPRVALRSPTAAQGSALLSEMGEKSPAVWLQVGEDRGHGHAIMGRWGHAG